MAESWNVLDMANNIANQIWKHSISQNVAPVASNESFNSNLLQKLGIAWVANYAPAFYLNSRQVSHFKYGFLKICHVELCNVFRFISKF